MDCELVYAIVPRTSLRQTVETNARAAARRIMGRVNHSMALEGQAVQEEAIDYAVESLARQLIERGDPRIWKP